MNFVQATIKIKKSNYNPARSETDKKANKYYMNIPKRQVKIPESVIEDRFGEMIEAKQLYRKAYPNSVPEHLRKQVKENDTMNLDSYKNMFNRRMGATETNTIIDSETKHFANGLKGAVAKENAEINKVNVNVDMANKILAHSKLLAEYKNKVNELREKLHPNSFNVSNGTSTSRVGRTKKFTEKELTELKLLSDELNKMKEKVNESEIDINKNASSITEKLLKSSIFKLAPELRKQTTNEISALLDSTGNDDLRMKLYNLYDKFLTIDQKEWNSKRISDLQNIHNIEETQSKDIMGYNPNDAQGRERKFNPQEVNAINAMERASLSPGAAKAREDSKYGGQTKRSVLMSMKLDADTLYKKWRQKGYSIEDAEYRASKRLTPIDDGPSHTKNWYNMQIQKYNQKMIENGTAEMMNPRLNKNKSFEEMSDKERDEFVKKYEKLKKKIAKNKNEEISKQLSNTKL